MPISHDNPQTLYDIFLRYIERLPKNKASQIETSIIKYCIPFFGFTCDFNKRRSQEETFRGYEFLKSVPANKVVNLIEAQESLFSKLGDSISGDVRRHNRSELNKKIEWCKEQPWWRALVNGDVETYAPKRVAKEYGHAQQIRSTERKKLPGYSLQKPKMPLRLKQEFEEFEEYWLSDYAINRQDEQVVEASISLYTKELRKFYGWLHSYRGFELSELSFDVIFAPRTSKSYLEYESQDREQSLQLITRYLSWRRKERKVRPNTEMKFLGAILNLAKFCYRRVTDYPRIKKYEDILIIKEIRSLMTSTSQRAKQLGSGRRPDLEELTYPELLECAQALKLKCATRTAGGKRRKLITIAKAYQRYLLVSFLTYMYPRRQRVYRELEMGRTLKKIDNKWRICLWYEKSYKTFKTYGKVTLNIPEHLDPFIEDWVNIYRKEFNPENNYFFVRTGESRDDKAATAGTPHDEGSLRSLFRNAVYAETGKICTPHDTRSIVVGHMRDNGASDAVMESLALGMGHSREMQQKIYDKRTKEQKMALAETEMLKMAGLS